LYSSGVLALFSLCLLATGVDELAQDPIYVEAQKLEGQFEYARAAALLEKVAKDPSLSAPARARALVELGDVRATILDSTGAEQAFTDAVNADPTVDVPSEVSPKVRDLFNAVKERTLAAASKAVAIPELVPAPAAPAPAAPPTPAHGDGLFIGGAVTASGGAVIALAGAGGWLYALSVLDEAKKQHFQSEAAALDDQSALEQGVSQVVVGVGALAVVAGGALLAVSAVE
jgi:hypothetical protein